MKLLIQEMEWRLLCLRRRFKQVVSAAAISWRLVLIAVTAPLFLFSQLSPATQNQACLQHLCISSCIQTTPGSLCGSSPSQAYSLTGHHASHLVVTLGALHSPPLTSTPPQAFLDFPCRPTRANRLSRSTRLVNDREDSVGWWRNEWPEDQGESTRKHDTLFRDRSISTARPMVPAGVVAGLRTSPPTMNEWLYRGCQRHTTIGWQFMQPSA
jgi:hypothetical protein